MSDLCSHTTPGCPGKSSSLREQRSSALYRWLREVETDWRRERQPTSVVRNALRS